MKLGDKKVVMASIDALMEELMLVVKEARKVGADDVWLLNYIIAELPYVFRKEVYDVSVQQMRGDVRLP